MSILEVLQLVGYSLGAVLPLWMASMLIKRRADLGAMQRLLLALALCMGGWHASNLVVTVHTMLGLSAGAWTTLLRFADSIAVISITFTYSLLLHVHLHLWANARSRELTKSERVRVYLSYIPCVFLLLGVPRIWIGSYAPMFVKLSVFVLPFVLWIAYCLGLVALTEILIARRARNPGERRIMTTLAVSFVGIALLILAALALGLGEGTALGLYLKTLANLGSLLPSALLAYYIYRYRFLELIIKESLIVASFAAVVLAIYLYGIRTIGEWLTGRYGVRTGVIEGVMILALTLIAAPLRRWLEKKFRKLFERETALYRDVVARIGSQAGHYKNLPDLLDFVEAQTTKALALRRVKIVVSERGRQGSVEFDGLSGSSSEKGEDNLSWIEALIEKAKHNGSEVIENESALADRGYSLAYPLRREGQTVGLMLIEAAPSSLAPDVRAVLEVLAGQVAIAIEDCRLVEENVRLERKLAEGERLAALGQMAATVAHEVKNPLSAIKSIAQVMREDDNLSDEYNRDLTMIVGETDRLSQSVTQLLSFARKEPPASAPCGADDVARAVADLFRAHAGGREISIECSARAATDLDGTGAAAIRDSLSNLLLNALQATPAGGQIHIEAFCGNGHVVFAVTDSGPGISSELQIRIWEPFFTTRQRGTGLGLAIVRKRMQEAGGTATLVPREKGRGARFELHLPLN
ncbi:MAG: ATP-binding protein [Pyrinomonadaceae bacterium]